MSRATQPERWAPATIDYDDLYDRYLASLVDTLRGFSSGIEGLEFFVPSEDPEVSLVHMLEAAAAEGRGELSVRFGPRSSARLAAATLERLIAPFGRGQVLGSADGLVVEVKELRARPNEPAPVGDLQPRRAPPRASTASDSPATPAEFSADAYGVALGEAARRIRHEGALPEPPAPAVRVDVEWGGVGLALAIDPSSHTILGARFAGVASESERALLDCFCALLVGLPLLEAVQHGVIRLEHRLRDPAGRPPVAGVITPEAAHPMFGLPQKLIRAALVVYRARHGYQDIENRYDPPLAPEWRGASKVERLARLARILESCRPGLALQDRTLELRAVEHDVRVVVALDPRLPRDQQRTVLLVIERAMQDQIDPRLELYAEERKDRNKLRRLQVVPEG